MVLPIIDWIESPTAVVITRLYSNNGFDDLDRAVRLPPRYSACDRLSRVSAS